VAQIADGTEVKDCRLPLGAHPVRELSRQLERGGRISGRIGALKREVGRRVD